MTQRESAPVNVQPAQRVGPVAASSSGLSGEDSAGLELGEPARHARLRRGRWALQISLLVADVLMLALATAFAYSLRQALPGFGRANDLSANVLDSGLIIALGWLLAIQLFGGYSTGLIRTGPELYRNLLHASLAAAGIVGAFLYLAGTDLSRSFFVVLFVVGPLLLLLNRVTARRIVNLLRRRGHFRQDVLAVGAPVHVEGIARTLHRESWLGYDVVGAVVPVQAHPGPLDSEIPVLGTESDLIDVVRRIRPSVVLFTAGSAASAEQFRRMAWELEDQEISVIVVPGLSEISSDRVRMRPVAGLPLVHMDLPRSRESLKLGKRAFDVITSASILLAIAPLMALLAVIVKLDDGGPVIFRQVRVGRNGEPFEFLKFRSMVTDAEALLQRLQEQEQDRGNDVMFKMADDPRITKPGRIMRRFSLDELPQLWNVLRGDMSLVGPRPALPREVSSYAGDVHRRLAVRPGITGLWQVSGRSDLSWDETVRLDLYYVDNWSFTQDVLILGRTVRAVLSSRGAY